MRKSLGRSPKTPRLVRVAGCVMRVLEKSIIYRLPGKIFGTDVFVPRSQLEIVPQLGDRDILMKRWLVEKNSWPALPVMECDKSIRDGTKPELSAPAKTSTKIL